MSKLKENLLAVGSFEDFTQNETPTQENVAEQIEATDDVVTEAEYSEIYEVVDFAIELQKAYGIVTEDNAVTLKDAVVLPDVITKGKRALTGIKNIRPKSILQVMPRLLNDFAPKFDLADDVLEDLIVESVTVLLQNVFVGKKWTSYFRNRK